MGLNSREKLQLRQAAFDFLDQPQPVLRAIRATPNDKARDIGLHLFENMRIPEGSIINRAYQNGQPQNESLEDMSWWAGQPACPVKVETRLISGAVEALIVPI